MVTGCSPHQAGVAVPESLGEDLQQLDADLGLLFELREEDPPVNAEALHLVQRAYGRGPGPLA